MESTWTHLSRIFIEKLPKKPNIKVYAHAKQKINDLIKIEVLFFILWTDVVFNMGIYKKGLSEKTVLFIINVDTLHLSASR